MARWEGPMSVAFFIDNTTKSKAEHATKSLADLKIEFADVRPNVRIVAYCGHPVSEAELNETTNRVFPDGPRHKNMSVFEWFEQKKSVLSDPLELARNLSTWYPINTMRNVGVDLSATNWVLTVDMDLVPSSTLYQALKREHLVRALDIDKPVLIVPPWEALTCPHDVANYSAPTDIISFAKHLSKGLLRPFHAWPEFMDPGLENEMKTQLRSWGYPRSTKPKCSRNMLGKGKNAIGVRRINYKKWMVHSFKNHSGMYSIDGKDFPTHRFEPVAVIRRVQENGKLTPRYDEHFVGRGPDKIVWTTALKKRSFQFFTLTQDFLVHAPHRKVCGDTSGTGLYGNERYPGDAELLYSLEENARLKKLPKAINRNGTAHFMCPMRRYVDPGAQFIRNTTFCPDEHPYEDHEHHNDLRHGDTCRDSEPPFKTWTCPKGCTQTPNRPYCYITHPKQYMVGGAEATEQPCRFDILREGETTGGDGNAAAPAVVSTSNIDAEHYAADHHRALSPLGKAAAVSMPGEHDRWKF
jgi:hypothetical protein